MGGGHDPEGAVDLWPGCEAGRRDERHGIILGSRARSSSSEWDLSTGRRVFFEEVDEVRPLAV